MNRDEADAVLPIVYRYTSVQAQLDAIRIARGDDPAKVMEESGAAFDKAYWAALAEVQSRPWWRRLRNLLP